MIEAVWSPVRMALVLLLLNGIAATAAQSSTQERYAASDALFALVALNVDQSNNLETIVEIDHSRLAAEAGSDMPPARVLLFSDRELETALMLANPLVGIDLPLRVLAYEATPEGDSRVIYNDFDYLTSRYGLAPDSELGARYEAAMALALDGIPQESIAQFESDSMQPDGIITLDSSFDMETTLARLRAAIDEQDDTVWFGEVDFQARAAELGETVAPARLLLFGGPGPGGKAMANAPTLGLDAFCQKLLVWQAGDGTIKVSFNDLLDVAERQMASKSIALRVVNFRIGRVFESALKTD